MKHVFQSHSADPLFTFSCLFANCLHVFKPGSTYFSFQSHTQRKQPNWKEKLLSLSATTSQESEGAPSSVQLQSTDERYQLDEHIAGTLEESSTLPQVHVSTTGPSTISQSAAQFLLTLKEKYCLTQAAVDFAMGSVNQIMSHICNELHWSVEGIQESHIAVPAALDEAFTPIEPLEGLTTEYQQSKHYREHFGLVVRKCSYVKTLG